MAMICCCDGGCGKSGDPAAFVTLGVVIKRQYCEECRLLAEIYIDGRDALHTELAAAWRTRLAELQRLNRVAYDGIKLPDVADPEPAGD